MMSLASQDSLTVHEPVKYYMQVFDIYSEGAHDSQFIHC